MKKPLFFVFGVFCALIINHFSVDSIAFQKKTSQNDLQHEVTVTLKLIQVYVSDKDGKTLMDLGIDDFEIYDNKKRMELTELEKYTLSLPAVENVPVKPIVEPEPEEKAAPAIKMTRKFFLFFDFAFNNRNGLQKSKEAAIYFIDSKLQQEDEVGLLSYSAAKGLNLHEYLTTDHQKVKEIVDAFGVKNIFGRAENVEEQYWRNFTGIPSSEASDPGFTSDGTPQSMRALLVGLDRREYKQQVTNFALLLEDLAKALRYIPGQKHIILFSSGIAYSMLYGVASPFGSPRTLRIEKAMGETVERRRYEDMMKELAASNCKVYALDSEELRTTVHMDEQMKGGGSLKRLSKVTGGKYYEHIHKYEEALDEIQNITGSYYVLGYYIDEKWDGKYHKIKVKAKKKGLKIHAQGGYYNPKPFKEYSKLEKQIHLVDLALTERPLFQDPVRFDLEASHNQEDTKGNLSLVSQIHVEKLNEIAGNKVEIVSLVFNENEDIVAFKRKELDFSKLPPEEYQYTSCLSVPPGEYKCRVVIRNLETGKGAVGSASVIIPEDSNFL